MMVDSVFTAANIIATYMADNGSGTQTLYPVGVGVKVGTFEHNYNVDRAYGIGDRVADVMYSKGFEGSMSFDCILTDDNTPLIAGFLSDSSLSDTTLYLVKTDGSVLSGTPTITEYWQINGFKPDSVKITARAGEFIGLSIEGKYKSSDYKTGQSTPMDVSGLINEPLTFANASISVGGTNFGIDTTIVKEFEIDIKHNIERLLALNNLYPQVLQEQKFDADLTLNVYMDSTTWGVITTNLSESSNNYLHGTYPNNTITLTVTGSTKTYTFTADGVSLNTFSTTFEDANVIEGQMKLLAKTVTLS